MSKVKVLVLRTAGTNCDKETAFAFEKAGGLADLVHINELTRKEKSLDDYRIMAIPGGFTYGDDIGSGKILANELKFKIEKSLQKFIKQGKLIIGICNGFQVLVKAGLLPNLAGDFQAIESTLTLNDSDKFEDRWVYLRKPETQNSKLKAQSSKLKTQNSKLKTQNKKSKKTKAKCIWTEGMDEVIQLPVAHGEGKFIPKDKDVLRRLKDGGLIVFEYVDENGHRAGYPYCPNGSVENIAGICDPTGRIFGLMPHPERNISPYQHPGWTRTNKTTDGDGFAIFKNGVGYAMKYL